MPYYSNSEYSDDENETNDKNNHFDRYDIDLPEHKVQYFDNSNTAGYNAEVHSNKAFESFFKIPSSTFEVWYLFYYYIF